MSEEEWRSGGDGDGVEEDGGGVEDEDEEEELEGKEEVRREGGAWLADR